ncbi:MAG: signal recognition particle protein [Bdellovibrionales bacterium]|nr:signal recognition particle protein [Bdellovibrionales bacterium]
MFDRLSERLLGSVKLLRGQKKITEENIQETIKEIRLSLLEADVNFKVVKTFIDRVKEKAIGQDVVKGIDPGQQFVKIVNDELITLLGGQTEELKLTGSPTIIFLVGLQGVGKTTTAGKLARHIKTKLNKSVVMASVDVYRPAAIEQLKQVGAQAEVPVFNTDAKQKVTETAKEVLAWAKAQSAEVILLDTAGRLQIDDELMTELSSLKSVLNPQEIILVADAMLGQQSVNVAEGFNAKIPLTGLILTKIDGDARGGAALSIRESIGVPIKFFGVGEKQTALEVFHPDRLASRILDMGDIVTLVEKAQEVIDEKSAMDSAQKMMKGEFTIEDFLTQMRQIKKLGSMEGILKMIPGMGQLTKQMQSMTPPDEELKKMEAIICSMTPQERKDHRIINGSRVVRIAKGSGNKVQDVNKFLKKFEASRSMMSQLMKMGMGGGGGFPGMGGMGGKFPF